MILTWSANKMRAAKTIIVGILLLLVLFFGIAVLEFPFLVLPSPYLSFMRKDAGYYPKVAHACEVIMQQHPVSSNDSVKLYQDMVLPYTLKLPGNDPTLPKIIRALHPDRLLVSTNRVLIEIPPEKMGGFVVIWERDAMRSNIWILQSNGDGLVKTAARF